MTVFAFYLFALCAIAGGLFTVLSRHPVHSVLWLILAFLSSAGLFVMLGAEFLAMLLVIVYVGAVLVLFIFVVMMLDIDFAALKAEMARYMPLALLMALILLMQFAMAFGVWQSNEAAATLRLHETPVDVHNTAALGQIIYDRYFLMFQLAGLILLETNTQPGMTPASLAPEQAAHCGISFPDLCKWLVEDASCDR